MFLKRRKNTRRFFYHYNKPESTAQGRNVLTVHWQNKCHHVHDILCFVPTETHTQKQQPRCVVRGWASHVGFAQSRGTRVAMIGRGYGQD